VNWNRLDLAHQTPFDRLLNSFESFTTSIKVIWSEFEAREPGLKGSNSTLWVVSFPFEV